MAGPFCIGCSRTLDEITNWTNYTVEERTIVLERIQRRIDVSQNK